ncbi:hypothetical protein EJ02DRAFT_439461 [Clathrospora elynae]|uniref:Uncharacterized protein n=1 Tax=Clathrospora elynae TaxID=706981 RepID=A0A6A5S9L1_9PLEO|nr:hypothetical protein EJ02DRAFT_439461 [Clathrospora elynae]
MFRPFKNTTTAHAHAKPFAAALSQRSTEVGKGKAKAKRAPLHCSPAAPPATPLPKPPAPSSLSPPSSRRGAPGTLRVHPCLGCVRSALAGRSSGECFDQSGGGSRCFQCASGHSCIPASALAAPIAAKFLALLQGSAPELQLRKLRIALHVVLESSAKELGSSEEEEKEGQVEEEDASKLPQGLLERCERIKELLGELVDLIVV